jgi:hypothetical protein
MTSQIPAAQVQSDWNETDTSKKSFIQNKPTIPAAQEQADWNATEGMGVILNKPNMSLYALKSELTTELTAVQTNETTLVAQAGKCYIFSNPVSELSVTLPDASNTSVKLIMLYFKTTANPNISFGPSGYKRFSVFEFEANASYEVNCLFNGSYWVLANAKIQDVL